MHLQEIKDKSPQDLFAYAEELGIEAASNQRRQELIFSVLLSLAQKEETITGSGVLEKLPDGFGYLRSADSNFLASADDIYVPARLIAAHSLRTGDLVEGELVAPSNSERYFSILNIEKVNTDVPDKAEHRMHFDNLTPLFPDRKIKLESDKPTKSITCRVIDMITPLGFGQRALIVAPPRTGKTILMQEIAHAITDNHPDVYLMVLLVDERPEEVTDMKRSVRGEVVASTFDEPADRHVKVADMVLARAKRMVECKKDVIVLLDSITRLARAYNTVQPSSGKVLTGGVDANALQKPKRFFGAARNIEQGGSLSIIATALVETGSRMDEVIFEEFKGTGNSEVILDRKLSDKRTFPAIDITRSGTRKEELLLGAEGLSKVWVLRRILSTMGTVEAMEFLRGKMKNTKTNAEFFDSMNQ